MCIRDSFYTVALELAGLTVSGERMADKAAAEQLKEACQGVNVTIKKVECKEKSEKPPALYLSLIHICRGYIRTGRTDPTGMEWQYFQYD